MTPESDTPKPEQEYDSAGKIEFQKPEGLELPDGSSEGDEVEMVATFRIEGEKLCLVAVEGMPVEGGEKTEPEAELPTDGTMKFEDAMEERL